MDPDGANAKQVTIFAAEADGVLYSPDGKNLLFTSAVYPECGADNACNQKNLDADAASKVKARIYTELLYRHWTPWQSQAAQPSAGGSGRRRRAAKISRPARATCRRSRSAAPTITTFPRMASRSAIP